MKRFGLIKMICLMVLLCAVTTIAAQAQNFTTLMAFTGPNGANPGLGPLVQGFDGNLYGTTYNGGSFANCEYGCGEVFKIAPDGSFSTVYSFCSVFEGYVCLDGTNPYGGLALGMDGNLYGTTQSGGAYGWGTVFKLNVEGILTTLYSFCAQAGCPDGRWVSTPLVQGSDGSFYGTTWRGGNSACGDSGYGCGTVFKITPQGVFTTLYVFCPQQDCSGGSYPYAGLIQARDGNFYGTTAYGGNLTGDCADYGGCGTVFKISPKGVFTPLYAFCSQTDCPDGMWPQAPLLQANDGSFYGTASTGGAYGQGVVFRLTTAGTFTTLYSFCPVYPCADGAGPEAGLVQSTDGNFYGTALGGGTNWNGTVFKLTPAGTLTVLHRFCSQKQCSDGSLPWASLVQTTAGNFYGTTETGGYMKCIENIGNGGCGTVFQLSTSFGAFIRTLPTFGSVGKPVTILGNSLTGSTEVTFNGTAATFTVVSDTEITTTVPAGATTGKVQVSTPTGTLTSNTRFIVKP